MGDSLIELRAILVSTLASENVSSRDLRKVLAVNKTLRANRVGKFLERADLIVFFFISGHLSGRDSFTAKCAYLSR